MQKKSVGIIGFGRFGQLTAKHLSSHFDVFVSDTVDKTVEAERNNARFESLNECASKDIVILSVPISCFEKTVKEIAPLLKSSAIVADVCSVKEMPARVLNETIPINCQCIATHPLFGPETAKNGLKDLKIVLCPVRTKNTGNIVKFLESLGLEVIISTAEEHDRQMAASLALVHFLGKGLLGIGADKAKFATRTHEMFLELIEIVRKDSKQLFADMHKFNRFASATRKELIQKLTELDGELDEAVKQ